MFLQNLYKLKILPFIILMVTTILISYPCVTLTPQPINVQSSKIFIKDKTQKTLNFGVRIETAPISYQNEAHQLKGFCTRLIDLIENYLKEKYQLNNKFKIVKYPIGIESRFIYSRSVTDPSQDHRTLHLDGECGADSSRNNVQGITFSNFFYQTEVKLLVRKDRANKFDKRSSILQNHMKPRIGVIGSSIIVDRVKSHFNLDAVVVILPKGLDAVIKVLEDGNTIDAIALDEILLKWIKAKNLKNPDDFDIDQKIIISHESYALILPHDDRNWVTIINNFLNDKQQEIQNIIYEEINKPIDSLDKPREDNDNLKKITKFINSIPHIKKIAQMSKILIILILIVIIITFTIWLLKTRTRNSRK